MIFVFSSFNKIVEDKLNKGESKIIFKGQDSDISRLDLNNLVRGVMMMGSFALLTLFVKMIGDWDDDIMEEEEQKINGKNIRPTTRRKALYELTRKERIKHYVYQFLGGMGENVTDDLMLPVNPQRLLDVVKNPLVPVRLIEDLITYIGNFGIWIFGLEGARYEVPSPQNRYDAVKFLYNWADITTLDNAVSQLRTLGRVIVDKPYHESLEKMYDNTIANQKAEVLSQVYAAGIFEGLSEKESLIAVKEYNKAIEEVYGSKEFKEQFVMDVLKDSKLERKILSDEDAQKIHMQKMLIDAANKYFKEEAKKGKGINLDSKTIREIENKLNEYLDKL